MWTSLWFYKGKTRTLVRVFAPDCCVDRAEQQEDGSWEGLEGNSPLTKDDIQAITKDLEEKLANIRQHADNWLRENKEN